jgi:predicted RNA-binding Zn-ribbon protein involved in translation (DUF1610 family)
MRNTKHVKSWFMKCPKCGKLYRTLCGYKGEDGKTEVKCNKCGYTSKGADDWPVVDKAVLAFRCPQCNDYTADTSDNVNWSGAFREIVCEHGHIVSINGKPIEKQKQFKSLDFMGTERIGDNLYAVRVKTRRQQIMMRLLNIDARNEQPFFRVLPRKGENIEQYLLHSNAKLLGYVSFVLNWRGKMPLINQLYIAPEERQKGYAAQLVKYFIAKHGDSSSEFLLAVDSPSQKTINLLTKKLGVDANKIACLHLG